MKTFGTLWEKRGKSTKVFSAHIIEDLTLVPSPEDIESHPSGLQSGDSPLRIDKTSLLLMLFLLHVEIDCIKLPLRTD